MEDPTANGKDDSMKEEAMETEDNSGRKSDMHNSSTSLDKYVGKGRNSKYMTLLPEDFEPGDMDVLCGRGKRCFNSPVSCVFVCVIFILLAYRALCYEVSNE